MEIEQDLRIQKLEESTKQQSQLHTEKLRIIQTECEYWKEMKAVAKVEMQAMQVQLKYWTAKYNELESDIINEMIQLINKIKRQSHLLIFYDNDNIIYLIIAKISFSL